MKNFKKLSEKYFLYTSLIIFLGSCCKAYISNEFFYTNETASDFELRFYYSGNYKTFFARKGSVKEPFTIYQADSIVVYTNNIVKEVHHLAGSKNTSNANSVSFESPHNLFNYSNYQQRKIPLKCDGSITEMIYTFK